MHKTMMVLRDLLINIILIMHDIAAAAADPSLLLALASSKTFQLDMNSILHSQTPLKQS